MEKPEDHANRRPHPLETALKEAQRTQLRQVKDDHGDFLTHPQAKGYGFIV